MSQALQLLETLQRFTELTISPAVFKDVEKAGYSGEDVAIIANAISRHYISGTPLNALLDAKDIPNDDRRKKLLRMYPESITLSERVGDVLLGDHIEWLQPGGPHSFDMKGSGYVLKEIDKRVRGEVMYLVYVDGDRLLADEINVPRSWITKVKSDPTPKHIQKMIKDKDIE